MNKNLTEAQNAALERAWEMLKEQFEHVIVAFETECREGTDRVFDCNYHGGPVMAVGLAEKAKQTFLEGEDDEVED
jgi:translation initiation factor 2 alpha subunit (eIF-2alpha)